VKIRKKPVVVNGWPIVDLLAMARMGAGALPKEVRLAYGEGLLEFEVDRITIATLEGVMTGPVGWWLIQGVKGEWYPCDGEAFNQSYDIVAPVEDHTGAEVRIPQIDPYANSPEV
jgi:hypothetical protein